MQSITVRNRKRSKPPRYATEEKEPMASELDKKEKIDFVANNDVHQKDLNCSAL